MLASRGMGAIRPSKMPEAKKAKRKDGDEFTEYKKGGKVKSRVNESNAYTNPGMRKRLFEQIKASNTPLPASGHDSPRPSA